MTNPPSVHVSASAAPDKAWIDVTELAVRLDMVQQSTLQPRGLQAIETDYRKEEA